jgi:alkanesulfonate monooxygenase SsuD/methylene tetrahydromethanopterin reductase-like flavin-dependent oxidoreductase (luciferase family)
LGSAAGSAQLAAERGLPFSYAHFFGAGVEQGPAIVESYRRMFKPSARNPQPRTNVALAVFCAESDEEVAYHTSSLKLSRLNMARGQPMGIVPPDEALAHNFTPEEVAFLERSGMNSIQGTPGAVRAQLEHISQEFQTQDLSVVTICYSFEARVASYELLARSCGLTPRASHSA